MIVLGRDAEVAKFVCDAIGVDIPPPALVRDGDGWAPLPLPAIGVDHSGELVGGVVYTNYTGTNIEMMCAATSPRWLSRSSLAAFFAYPFRQLRVLRVTATVNKKNKRSRRMVEGLGFKMEGCHPKAGPDGQDAISYGMLREHCRWING